MVNGRRSQTVAIAALLLAASGFAFSQYGFEGRLSRDLGILMYGGQQMAKGVPPYVSLFDNTGPLSQVARRAALPVLCVILVMTEAGYYRKTRNEGLRKQRRLARQIEDEFGRDCRLVSISSPEILVLLNKTNPNRYLFIASGIDNLIDATEAGGFEGWLRQLEAYDAPVIALGPTTGRRARW